MRFGGWGNIPGPQHNGCMCEVINLGDLLPFLIFLQSTHSSWLWAWRFHAGGSLHGKARTMSQTFHVHWCSRPFHTYSYVLQAGFKGTEYVTVNLGCLCPSFHFLSCLQTWIKYGFGYRNRRAAKCLLNCRTRISLCS